MAALLPDWVPKPEGHAWSLIKLHCHCPYIPPYTVCSSDVTFKYILFVSDDTYRRNPVYLKPATDSEWSQAFLEKPLGRGQNFNTSPPVHFCPVLLQCSTFLCCPEFKAWSLDLLSLGMFAVCGSLALLCLLEIPACFPESVRHARPSSVDKTSNSLQCKHEDFLVYLMRLLE